MKSKNFPSIQIEEVIIPSDDIEEQPEPEPEPTQQFRMLPTAYITPGAYQPRKRFVEQQLIDMAESMKSVGVLQPIIVRLIPTYTKQPPIALGGGVWTVFNANNVPLSNHATESDADAAIARLNDECGYYEIVAGEKRWRAAKMAFMQEMPALIRELTDREVIEIQVIENLQRSDVHPIEEADGYDRMMREYGYSAESLAVKVGKSKSYIYARLKLLALCPEAKEMFFEDAEKASVALLIARIPSAALQQQAMQTIWNQEAPLSYRKAADYILQNFMLRLSEAPFDIADASLVSTAGSCINCPKRTGNQTELFADIDSADVCTDTECFSNKKSAHWNIVRLDAEKKKIPVITGTEAIKLRPTWARHGVNSDEYELLDDVCEADDTKRTYRQLFGKKAPVDAIIEDPRTGNLMDLVKLEKVDKLLDKLNIGEPNVEPAAEKQNSAQREEKRKLEEAKEKENKAWVEKENLYRSKLLEAIGDANTGVLSRQDANILALTLIVDTELAHNNGLENILVEQYGFDHNHLEESYESEIRPKLLERIVALTDLQFVKLLLTLTVGDELLVYTRSADTQCPAERLIAIAKNHNIDTEALREEIFAEPAAEEPPAPKKAKRKKTATAEDAV